MPLVRKDGRTIFFAHVPKVGGTSVEDYLARRFGPLSIVDRHKRRGVRRTGLITAATHLSALDLEELLPADLDYAFAVVRAPLDRLISEYRYQTGASRAARLSPSTWIRLMLACARIDPRVYGNHIRPQSDLVPAGAEAFRLEDGFEALEARLDDVAGGSAPGLSIGHLNQRPRRPVTLYREDIALVTAFYAEDYRRFGYPLPDPAEAPHDRWAAAREAFARAFAPVLVWRQRLRWLR